MALPSFVFEQRNSFCPLNRPPFVAEALGGGADVRLLRAVLGQLRSGDRASQTGTAQKKGKAWH